MFLLSLLTFFGISHVIVIRADVGIPLIQISHDDLDEEYPEMKEEVHLEDFFWTGSGDGPPDYLKKIHTGISKGKEVIVKTETVVATVYVDGNNEIEVPICLDCPPDDDGGGGGGSGGATWSIGNGMPPLNYTATDRRYWLLTVMSGFYSQKDNPMLEEKLARLYRLAFTRQQSKHLGINGSQQIAGISIGTGRGRREHSQVENSTERDPDEDIEVFDMAGVITSSTKKPISKSPSNIHSELLSSSEESEEENFLETTTEASISTTSESYDTSSEYPAYITLIPWELIQQNAKSEKQTSSALLEPETRKQIFPQHPLIRDRHVRVLIHNITQISEDDVQKGIIGGSYDMDVNEKIDERPIANQTEVIYSVFVNGRPVWAVTAANDMKLVSEEEVSEVIGKEVYMKAEPYLREPQATPLAPATHHSGKVGFIDSVQNNPALVVVSSVAILLLLMLLVALLLMGRSCQSRKKAEEVNRSSSHNVLLVDDQSTRPISSGTVTNTGRSTVQSRDVGIQNFSFENESSQTHREARIHFPGPPDNNSRRGSITSTDNTSDSSVYCPINPPNADVQRMLDEKAATLFETHKRRQHHHQRNDQDHQYDRAEGREETGYTSVLGNRKRDKTRQKAKRRYLSENRVGSLDTSPVQAARGNSSADEVATDSTDGETLHPTYQNFERNEAYNPHNNYHRNKLLQQKSVFKDKQNEEFHTTEAINREIIRALKPTEKSSDTASIGSFLSMASVKAFPKSTLPEPLNRVLEPVFVTYYDNLDNSMSATVPQTSTKAKATQQQHQQRKHRDHRNNECTIATIENFPTPKAPSKSTRQNTQSDNPDPGVIGPIVWERHKKRMAVEMETDLVRYADCDVIHDPAAIRNHYEGLLEGAIQMYSSQDDLPMPLPERDFTNNRKLTKREYRGSSAGLPSYAVKSHNVNDRPSTAQPEKVPNSNQSTQPPSPTIGAWGGSLHSSHSPLVRPLSAGPFHRPESSQQDDGRLSSNSNRLDMSAAPLIEAIQTELRRFKQDSK